MKRYDEEYFYYMRGVYQKNKNLVPGKPYHIIQRAPGREQLFIEDEDYLQFLRLLKEIVSDFNFEIRAFCLMPNHLHILGSSNEDNFSEVMKSLFLRYAKIFNSKYNRKGHVFHGPFRVVPVNREFAEVVVSLYIHLNPVKARLVENDSEWNWSSVELYYHPNKKSLVNPKPVLSLISKDIKEASQQYVKMLEELKGSALKEESSIGEKGMIQDFLIENFRKFLEWFKNSYLEKEYEIISELDRRISEAKTNGFARRSAYLYAMDQLLAQGFSNEFVMKLLGLSRSTYYRYLNVRKNVSP